MVVLLFSFDVVSATAAATRGSAPTAAGSVAPEEAPEPTERRRGLTVGRRRDRARERSGHVGQRHRRARTDPRADLGPRGADDPDLHGCERLGAAVDDVDEVTVADG